MGYRIPRCFQSTNQRIHGVQPPQGSASVAALLTRLGPTAGQDSLTKLPLFSRTLFPHDLWVTSAINCLDLHGWYSVLIPSPKVLRLHRGRKRLLNFLRLSLEHKTERLDWQQNKMLPQNSRWVTRKRFRKIS